MENQVEMKWKPGLGVGFSDIIPVMENRMEKKMENETETGKVSDGISPSDCLAS